MKKNGQALIFVFFLLLLVGILSSSLSALWRSQINIRAQERSGIIAFYLAQAAVERGKVEVLYGYWLAGATIANQNDLDTAGDGFQFLYDVIITSPGTAGANSRDITGIGRVLDLNNTEIARRQAQIIIDNIEDTVAPVNEDDDLSGTVVSWSWQET
ncbi:MAG: hypothetical protein HY810_10620 [Candidatus Omnitrophica bacterium]|nr:hypothetical protein [Candidatus Omnitrophota bacterium]